MAGPRSRTIGSWNPEHARRSLTAKELVRDFLLVTERLPRDEVALLSGVSRITLRKWERGSVRNLPGTIRERLRSYLVQNGFGPESRQ